MLMFCRCGIGSIDLCWSQKNSDVSCIKVGDKVKEEIYYLLIKNGIRKF